MLASAPAVWGHGGLDVAIDLPAEPGRYRLTTTIHDAQDVALDAPTQALVAVLIVQVSRPVSVTRGSGRRLAPPAVRPGVPRTSRPGRRGAHRTQGRMA